LYRGGGFRLRDGSKCHRGGREPRRSKSVLGEAAIEEHVSGSGIDVLDLVLNAAANNGQGINLISDIGKTALSSLRDGSQRGVDFQVVR